MLEKPGKYLIGGLTPPVDQGSRANCWLFAIVGVLEDSYRRQGIERGWLSEDMYLYLSRQSLGISIMDICKQHPSGLCPATTSADGSVIAWGNTTNWADEKLLWYLKELGTKALPGSVCPYTVSATGEKVCEGMEAALQTNPLEFKVKRADIFYDIPDMQRHCFNCTPKPVKVASTGTLKSRVSELAEQSPLTQPGTLASCRKENGQPQVGSS